LSPGSTRPFAFAAHLLEAGVDASVGTVGDAAERVDWFNNQRLHTAIGDTPPHEHETNHYARHQPQPAA
jgi:putative transposase